MMSLGHLFYIPLIGLVGMAWGYVLGAKAARQKFEVAQKQAAK